MDDKSLIKTDISVVCLRDDVVSGFVASRCGGIMTDVQTHIVNGNVAVALSHWQFLCLTEWLP